MHPHIYVSYSFTFFSPLIAVVFTFYNMRTTIFLLVLMTFIVLTCLTIAGQSHFVPNRQNVHFGNVKYPRRWGRWCSEDMECGRGFCEAYMCQCYRGYITWHFMEVCAYEQRTKLSAFLVSFFVGLFGIDWFVLSRGNPGYIVTGIIKLIISLAFCFGWAFILRGAAKKDRNQIRLAYIINILLTATSILWWLTDWIRVLADVFYDGNRAPLQPWGYQNYYDRMPSRW